jgi:DNA-binding CsgD family transcriptional regulator
MYSFSSIIFAVIATIINSFEVFKLIAKGQSQKEIGNNLSISHKTVSTYRTRILDKLTLRTTSDLIHYAIEYKLSD